MGSKSASASNAPHEVLQAVTAIGSLADRPGGANPSQNQLEIVIAEDVFPAEDVPRAEVRVGIEGIIVTDETMELRLVLTPEEGAAGIQVGDVLNEVLAVDVRLIDRENLKEYKVLCSGGCSASDRYQPNYFSDLTAGQSLAFPSSTLPPEDDIDNIDVQINSSLPVFEDVPLTLEK